MLLKKKNLWSLHLTGLTQVHPPRDERELSTLSVFQCVKQKKNKNLKVQHLVVGLPFSRKCGIYNPALKYLRVKPWVVTSYGSNVFTATEQQVKLL